MKEHSKTLILEILISGSLALCSLCCKPALSPGKWVFIRSIQVDNMQDMATIIVGRSKGTFSCLRFEALNPMVISQVRVFFEKGEEWSPNIRLDFPYGKTAHVINLPTGERLINKVEFRFYGIKSPIGRTIVDLSGGK